MYIVGFNGPPECGKDTLAQMVMEHTERQLHKVCPPIWLESLSFPLRHIAYAMVGRTYREFGDLNPGELKYSEFKNTYFPRLKMDGRHLMIAASEQFLKPVYGDSVMADMLIERNRPRAAIASGLLLVRDSGFQCEMNPLIDEYGADNVLIVNVMRPGKSFDNDSREWVAHTNRYAVDNNGSLEDLRTEAGRIYGRMVNNLGWKL